MIVSANRRLQSILPVLLGRHETLAYQGTVSNPTEALILAGSDAPDVVVSDLPPAGVRDILTWRAIRESGPRIVMLTRYMHEGDDMRAVLAGASGLILVPERRLLESIMHAATGDLLRSEELRGRLSAIVSGEAPSALDGSERRILGLIAEGHPDREIAARIGVSPDDVRDQIAGITQKLG
jgi:DNA-binding NarL/FixJ family response regulator